MSRVAETMAAGIAEIMHRHITSTLRVPKKDGIDVEASKPRNKEGMVMLDELPDNLQREVIAFSKGRHFTKHMRKKYCQAKKKYDSAIRESRMKIADHMGRSSFNKFRCSDRFKIGGTPVAGTEVFVEKRGSHSANKPPSNTRKPLRSKDLLAILTECVREVLCRAHGEDVADGPFDEGVWRKLLHAQEDRLNALIKKRMYDHQMQELRERQNKAKKRDTFFITSKLVWNDS